MPARRRSGFSTGTRTQKEISKPRTRQPKPEVNVAELRKELAGFKKNVDISITQEDVQGKFNDVIEFVRDRAEKNGFDFNEIEIRRIQTGRYRDGAKWVIRGKRDYTDDELKTLGPKLLAQKAKADKRAQMQRDKDLATIRRLASKHGLPNPTAADQVVDKRKK